MAASCCSNKSKRLTVSDTMSELETPSELGMTSEDLIKKRYPMVCEKDTPLPRQWSSNDRCNHLGLSPHNLRVHYKGTGKNLKDAASVRTTHPIPAGCGIYYYEVKVVSKGREGYMGIGVSTSGVNISRLPGWEKNSYGYHGDDGNSFCSSGTGQPYGPTFTTGDVIGCCINLIENSCFYTKNGVNLGVAFRNLPANLYPTVGLQTPGEVVEANFGQAPFIFDIDDYVQEWRVKTKTSIEQFSITNKNGEWQTALQKVISSYLIHNGYLSTAEAFARSTGQAFDEEITSIRNRQNIQKLILSGRIAEAIDATQQLYPGLLDQNLNLLFTLKCRQFIEMVNGTDTETSPTDASVADTECRGFSPTVSPLHDPPTSPSVTRPSAALARTGSVSPTRVVKSKSRATNGTATDKLCIATENILNTANNPTTTNGTDTSFSAGGRDVEIQSSPVATVVAGVTLVDELYSSEGEDEMDTSETEEKGSVVLNSRSNGAATTSNGVETLSGVVNGSETICVVNGTSAVSVSNGSEMVAEMNGSEQHCCRSDHEADMDIDQRSVTLTTGRPSRCMPPVEVGLERILQFGRELHVMVEQLKQDPCHSINKKALKDAFSLLAYSDPWNSTVGHQLHPVQREPICSSLNSAILELQGLPKQPPLVTAIAHTQQCVKLMSKAGIGSCAFADVNDYLL